MRSDLTADAAAQALKTLLHFVAVEFVSQIQRDQERNYDAKREEHRSIGVN